MMLTHNQLTGSIPSEIGQIEFLVGLNLEENQLEGTVRPHLLCWFCGSKVPAASFMNFLPTVLYSYGNTITDPK